MSESDDRVAAIYRAGSARLQPSATTDRRILDAAHRAVHRQARRRQRWPYPALALAATLVIGVGIAWLQLAEPPVSLDRPAAELPTAAESRALPPPPGVLSDAASPDLKALPQQKAMAGQQMPQPAAAASPVKEAGSTPRSRQASDPEAFALQEIGKSVAGSLAAVVIETTDEACELPEVEAPVEAWRTLLSAARQRSDAAAVECLETAYQARYGNPIGEEPDPQ